jgi:microcystin-dependent protein
MPTLQPPIGTIMAYAGPVDDNFEKTNGWAQCNGRSVPRTGTAPNGEKYSDLFNAIGSSWGGDGVNNFNLPSLEGVFLRGVDGMAGNDPDKGSRTASKPGGHAGNQVGSFQADQVVGHSHSFTGHHLEADGGSGFDGTGFKTNSNPKPGFDGPQTSDTVGGNETRPKNAYVHWIIRYK